MKKLVFASLLLLPLASCGGGESQPSDDAAGGSDVAPAIAYSAELIAAETGDGGPVGDVGIFADGKGAKLELALVNMKPGSYGMHLHAVGKCEAPDFKSAGGHWNPAEKAHGTDNPDGAHAGDLPNLEVTAEGEVKEIYDLPVHSAENLSELLDADGAAFVIHAGPDDFKTDPSGDSGARIICGVFREVE